MRALLLKTILRLFACWPLAAVRGVGSGIGRLMTLLPNRSRAVTRVNLDLCFPQLSTADRQQLARQSLIETGRTIAEMGPLWYWPRERVLGLVSVVSGREQVDAALAAGRGAILASPHLGNWEMTGLYCSSHYAMTSLYRPPRIRELEAFMSHARERLGAQLVPANAAGVRALYRRLEQGEVVGILPDQEPGAGGGVFAEFFGIPAWTMTLIGRLVKRTGAPVFFTWAERLPGDRGFHVHFVAATDATAEGSIDEITAAINAGAEACIRTIPEQYQWSYKRFNTRPEGEARLYR